MNFESEIFLSHSEACLLLRLVLRAYQDSMDALRGASQDARQIVAKDYIKLRDKLERAKTESRREDPENPVC